MQMENLGAGGVVSSSQVCSAAFLVCYATTCGYFYVILLQASKAETAAALHQLQDKEKMLSAMKEEAAVAKEQCKQLSQVNIEVFMGIERSRGL